MFGAFVFVGFYFGSLFWDPASQRIPHSPGPLLPLPQAAGAPRKRSMPLRPAKRRQKTD